MIINDIAKTINSLVYMKKSIHNSSYAINQPCAFGENKCSGAWTATTSPRAHTSPCAERVDATTTLRPLISFIVARTSSRTPKGVGRT
jgi:hypothetical protein